MSFDAADLLARLFREAEPATGGATVQAPASPPAVPRWRRALAPVALEPGCPWCGGAVFWRSVYGATCCGECQPPPLPALVEMWLRVVATEDGLRVVEIGPPPSKE